MTTTELSNSDVNSYDYLIVGGGTAGCVIASRLAQYLPKKRILLIEAGPSDFMNDKVLNLKEWLNLLGGELDYDYGTTEQPNGNSHIRHSRAKVLGGCSSHNTLISFRPFEYDCKRWQTLGCEGWSFETFTRVLDNLRNTVQPVHSRHRNQLCKDWVNSCSTAMDITVIHDFNKEITSKGNLQDGVGFFSVSYNPDTGHRSSASVAYIHPILCGHESRPNLTILTNAWVSRVNVKDSAVTGINVTLQSGTHLTLHARKETIICAGAVDTPRLLLLSGIGPQKQLSSLGIDIVHDVPGIGHNLVDHPESIIIWELNVPVPPNQTTMDSDAGIFLRRSTCAPDEPADMMMHCYQIPFCLNTERLGYDKPIDAFCMTPNIPRPRSKGQLYLTSKDPNVKPALDFKYFTDPEGYDAGTIVAGLRAAREVAKQEPFKSWLKREVAPGPALTTDEELSEYGRRVAHTVYHPAGTTKMGDVKKDEMAVVDSNLRLRGLKGVRIADAGVFPEMPTINPMLTVLGIGERAAEMIAEEAGWKMGEARSKFPGATFILASAAAAGFLGRGNPGHASSMRGLVQFIADLRNARARDLEEKRINKELANIRQKFKEGNLNGYHKKKYVCKLLYIYILGWNVDFGHLEAVNLISANKYSEKQIGYLAVTLFLHEEHELLHLVVNSIRKDLLGNNELFNCLALHAIANVGGREMGEALSADVHRLLISPTSKAFVKKKAALTLLRLYRKHPGIVQHEWAERIISLMDDPDMGVTLSVTSLVMALAQDQPDQYKGCYVKAAQRLKKIVVDNDIQPDYVYYKVPCPWVQVKFLRLMQYYPPSDDTHTRNLIRDSLGQILHEAWSMPKNVQQNNAQNAVLFEAINLVIHLDTESALMVQISSRLGKFIQSRETNVRYLGLDAMTHFTARAETLDPIKRHQSIILGSLRDRDISVRRKGLDLLYSMCDATNSRPIVGELLKYLQSADFAIREEMVLKIAILTEKYATDIQWYVDISLRLIAMAGDHVSDEVWQRVIQIVTNNEELQVYAAQHILEYVKADQCHETLVKIGGYLLGEFGHLIADNEDCNPINQLMSLQTKLNGSSASTRAILLSCFIKFVNLFPEIKPQLLLVFRAYSHALDSELQQRACEYLTLATLPTDDLLRTVCDEMPPFPERTSALLFRLHGKHAGTSDKRTWVVGGKDANASAEEILLTQPTGGKRSFTPASGPLSAVTNGPKALTNGVNGAETNGMHDLEGLDLTPTSTKAPNLASAAHLSPGWEAGYQRLLFSEEGILYEDTQIQIGLRSEYRGPMGCIILYFTNRSSSPMVSFTTTIDNPSTAFMKYDNKTLPDSTVQPEQQAQQTTMFEARAVFEAPPTIRVSYLAGSLQALTLQLPVVANKFMNAAELSADDFFKRWKQIGGAPRESQKVFGLADGGKRNRMSEAWTKRCVSCSGWGILSDVDPNTRNIVGASVLHTVPGKLGCLLRLEPNYDSQLYRVTIRATDEMVPPVLMKFMEEALSQGTDCE